ncbi:uncharacterized protein LOC134255522 [Saccostrea cucullata]|uniref:uncharacterized protein LOC134255522 n=1 Tax=Saccostrea cuccullata TaxID=36930 RepID=UPI002ED42C8C
MAPTELQQRQQRQARQPSLLLVLPLLLHLSHIHISSSPFVANSQGVNHSPATYASTVFPLDTGKPTAPKTSHKVNDKYTEISDLMENKRILEVPFQPFVCSPLSVAENKNKKRLILDLIPDRRIDDAICCLQKTITHFPNVTARELARVVGKIISMTPVMDIFKVGRWTGINCGLQDHRLAELASELPRYCVTSKVENTAKQYRYAFNTFCFAGFLRFSEIVNIRYSDICIQTNCVEINIVKRNVTDSTAIYTYELMNDYHANKLEVIPEVVSAFSK